MQPQSQPDPYVSPEPPQRPGRGCLFYGCLFTLIVLLVIGVMIFLVLRYAWLKVDEYSDTQPMTLPKVELNQDQLAALRDRVKAFEKSLDEGKADTLTLTSDELNALIIERTELGGKLAVTIPDDTIRGQISLPLGNVPGLGVRYLNGEADLKLSLENGVFIATLDNVTVKGKPIPKDMMEKIRKENLAKDAYKNRENAEKIRKLESIEVKNGKLIITSRATAAAGAKKPDSEPEQKPQNIPPPEPAKAAPPEEV
jgi:hypothetical protein